MNLDDKAIAKALRHELARRQALDTSETDVIVQRGVAHIGGVIRPAGNLPYVNIEDELKALHDNTRRIQGLRDLIFEATVEEGTKK